MDTEEQKKFDDKQFLAVLFWLISDMQDRGDKKAAYYIARDYLPDEPEYNMIVQRLEKEAGL